MKSNLWLLFLSIICGQNLANADTNGTTPINYAVLLFPTFQALDVFGPLDMLNVLSLSYPINLSVIAQTLDPVSTVHHMSMHANSNFSESILPTHTFAHPPDKIDVLIVPGGIGTRAPAPALDPLVGFIKETYPQVKYLIGICTGAGLVARTGILDGLPATGNKKSWDWVTAQGPKVKWISHARWVNTGNIWTTSGISAGMDGTFDFVKEVYGESVAANLANMIEYERKLDWRNDPFADLYNLTDPVPK